MVNAIVSIIVGAGAAETVAEHLRDVTGVDEAHVVAGSYDVIAEVSGEAVYDILRVVSTEIGGLEGVRASRTYVVIG